MRFVKLGKTKFKTLDLVREFFLETVPRRSPPGKFRVTAGHFAQDGLQIDEQIVFTYDARVVLTARAGSGVIPNDDEERNEYPIYFVIDLATLRQTSHDLYEVQRLYNSLAGTDVGLVGQNWNRLSDSVHTAKVWTLIRGPSDFPLAEEVGASELVVEGAVREIKINAYERSSEARKACLKHHGPSCAVCGFDFGAVYGPMAQGFIHVHHLKQLSTIAKEHSVDSIADLRPVCANCHAIIHLHGGCRRIEEVRTMVDPRVLDFWKAICNT
jgi:hypothetical protein